MKRWIILLAIVLAALACTDFSWGQMPTAVITGPKEARPGSLVVLDASESQGLGRTWLLAVSPEPTSFWMPESRLQLLFASPTPGDYTFVAGPSARPRAADGAERADHSAGIVDRGAGRDESDPGATHRPDVHRTIKNGATSPDDPGPGPNRPASAAAHHPAAGRSASPAASGPVRRRWFRR
jgi:hypothetical protein